MRLAGLPTKVESAYVASRKDGQPGICLRSFRAVKESPMSIATYEAASAVCTTAVPQAKPVVAKRTDKQPGLFARLYAAFVEARHRRALEELKRHGVMLPFELEQAGWKLNEKNEDSLPFTR